MNESDVEKLRRTAARLLQAEAQAANVLEGILEAIPDAIVIVSSTGVITLANELASKLTGYSLAELIDEPVEMLVPDDLRGQHVQLRIDYHKAPAPRPMAINRELSLRCKDGSVVPVLIALNPIANLGGKFVIAVIRRRPNGPV